jgi:divalent metal cation (Fe/Co/Zn/Cd) transporter
VSTAAGRRLDTAEQRRFARIAVWFLVVTIGYNILEGIVAVAAGLMAGSVALTGFGFDSAIEVIAAAIVLWRLRAELRHGTVDERQEHRAMRALAITFFALAAYIVAEGIRDLLTTARPETSLIGIGLTALSAIVMPTLALVKRRNGERLGSRLVVTDAAETKLCAWLSISTLAGLGLFAISGWAWLDTVAGFVIALFAIREGLEAWSGQDSA